MEKDVCAADGDCALGEPFEMLCWRPARKDRGGTDCDRLAAREWKGREEKGWEVATLSTGGLALTTRLFSFQTPLLGVWHRSVQFSSLIINPTESSRSDDDLILISPNEDGDAACRVLRAAVKVIHHPCGGGRAVLINGLNTEWLTW